MLLNHIRKMSMVAGLLLAASVGPCAAQQAPQLHGAIYCIKALPGKGQEFERWVADEARKVIQVSLDAKRITGWSLSRAVTPTGEETRCSHILATFSEGAPAEPRNTLEEDVKKAGLRTTAQQYLARRDSLAKLVLHERYVRYAGFGAAEKGDYWAVNFMKPRPEKHGEFHQFESRTWLPIAEEAAKGGHPRKAWSAWHLLYPSGTAGAYDDVTVDTFRDWASVWKPQGFSKEVMEKVFPGKSQETVFSPLAGLRELVRRELYLIVESARAGGQ